MKRFLILLLLATLLLSAVACGKKNDKKPSGGSSEISSKQYAEYVAAEDGDALTIEAYVQATMKWGDGKITAYLQDEGGAYLAYELNCRKSDAEKLVVGTKIRVTGEKGRWYGSVRGIKGTFEVIEKAEPYIAPAMDVTSLLSQENLSAHHNKRVSFTRMTVQTVGNTDKTFFYKWDNAGSDGDDLYFQVTDGKNSYLFVVNTALTDANSDVYKAVKALRAGDVIDMEGFLHWDMGIRPYITSLKVVVPVA